MDQKMLKWTVFYPDSLKPTIQKESSHLQKQAHDSLEKYGSGCQSSLFLKDANKLCLKKKKNNNNFYKNGEGQEIKNK